MRVVRIFVIFLALFVTLDKVRAQVFTDRFQYQNILNDTGILKCGNASSNSADCPVLDYPGQDAQFGRDKRAQMGDIYKYGSGLAGFDFTKLNSSGQPVPDAASEWSCLRDNYTGLVWEVKSNAVSSPRFRDHTYTWFSSDYTTNGGNPGIQDGGFCTEGECDTEGYVELVNSMALCGKSSWRLPTNLEFLSIIDRSLEAPALDASYFPQSRSSSHYWNTETSQPLEGRAWTVAVSTGRTIAVNKDNAYFVRLVSNTSGSDVNTGVETQGYCDNNSLVPSTPSTEFDQTLDTNSVMHLKTGLEWKKCVIGQEWSDGSCVGTPTQLTWVQALQITSSPEYQGWRLPNINELASLSEKCRSNPAINSQVFPASPASGVWSSSPGVTNGIYVWVVDFYSGRVEVRSKNSTTNTYLRLVR